MGGRFQRGTSLRPASCGHRSRDSGGKFRSEKWDFSTRNLLLAAYTPPLRNKVREPAGSPTPFGAGLPGLILCRGQVRPQSECRLGKGFALPLAPNPVRQPTGFPTPFRGGLTRSLIVQELSAAAIRVQTGEGACGPLPLAPFPEGIGGGRLPSPLPPTRNNPSVRCGGQLPLSRGAGATPQSATADSSPYTGEPKQPLSHAAA